WAFLEVATNASYNDSLQAYAAGLAEAAVTEQLMYMHWMNTMVGYCGPFKYESEYCQKLRNYLEANLAWMEEQMAKGQDLEYWHQVRLALLQLKGLEDSYNGRLDFPRGRITLAPFGFLLLQLGGDLEDLESALNRSSLQRVLGSGSCSALVKLLPGHQDLLVAHDTWTSYQAMLRIIKKYTLPFRTSAGGKAQIPGSVQVFSSYPGTIFSVDDFYILSSGLVTLETTIGNNNPALWKYLDPRGSVLEWLRNIVANRLARSGPEWAAVFRRFNSGTYNNQWMVVDYKAFTPGRASPAPGVLTVLEQIPGLVVVADQTELLYQQGYWASYNRCHGGIDMKVWEPGSPGGAALWRCTPSNSPGLCSPFLVLTRCPVLCPHLQVTSSAMVPTFGLVAVSGPAWDDVPPFRWSASPCSSLLHMGHPDLWTFPPVKVHWD
ncbi:PLBLB protein, partial [Ptilorrhoa leucosticta]|nr:PLBLB protein [Ptilorrhoa leucosticta]